VWAIGEVGYIKAIIKLTASDKAFTTKINIQELFVYIRRLVCLVLLLSTRFVTCLAATLQKRPLSAVRD
jgi:hypothetical protein